jgi:hypothetical protein
MLYGVGTLAQAGAECCTTPPTLHRKGSRFCPVLALIIDTLRDPSVAAQPSYPIEQTCYHPMSQSGRKNLPLQ